MPVNAMKGDNIPVSDFTDLPDGTMPQGTSKYEKRGIAVNIPVWDSEKCIQCNMCSYVCPHSCIRPFLVTEEEAAKAQKAYVSVYRYPLLTVQAAEAVQMYARLRKRLLP